MKRNPILVFIGAQGLDIELGWEKGMMLYSFNWDMTISMLVKELVTPIWFLSRRIQIITSTIIYEDYQLKSGGVFDI